MTTRRQFLKGLAATAVALVLPPTLTENAEAARRFWALDQTMTSGGRVVKFNSTWTYAWTFGPSGNGQFTNLPPSFVIGPNGDPWVADGGNDRIQRFCYDDLYGVMAALIGAPTVTRESVR